MTVRPLPLLALPLLMACVAEEPAPAPAAPAPLDPVLGPIALAEQGCLRAVATAAGSSEVTVINSDFSEAGTVFQIGVGLVQSPWRCIGYSDGSTTDVRPLA
ncbi:hypothetical protein [Jannaschia seohaensis]|uniref:Lipoprotein n=1 Tax=Jannaschia seohaensis TaxID=475081 RepID=A0A2Y9AKQ0_9RHOB|nr:hypothetical protein [Jannaschia seohaensis]PWJ20530.1 hypothetical protein BCF38_103349 [Jannaschia seohaensis]SSA44626.1 hypothetical protein SAMN05421539_103349 [Jannaschia seohaensis]